MKRVLLVGLALLGLVLGLAAGILGWAHWSIRNARPAMPAADAIAAAMRGDDIPRRLSYINTATQKMPRSTVLDTSHDRNPQAPYVMSFPSFVLEWRDGRILLVDAGMTRDAARDFGKPIEALGADAIQPLDSAAETLGSACARVQGVVFTHLHSDHVGGFEALCKCAGHPIQVFMNATQATVTNHTTRGGLELIRASSCAKIQILPDEPLSAIPGFSGAAVAHAGGHTPGSQAIFARVAPAGGADVRYAFAGDLVNNIDGILHDISKPFFYSLLIVPEDKEQLSNWRHFLRQISENGYALLVAHDQMAIERTGIPKYAP